MNYSNEKEVALKGFKNALPFHLQWPGLISFLWSQMKTSLVVWKESVRKSTSWLAVSAHERPRTWAAGNTDVESIFGGEANSKFVCTKLR